MAMEVLRPQDCYRTDHHLPRSGRGSCRNSFSAPRPATRRHPREREGAGSARPEARQRGRFVRARSEPAIPTPQEEAGQQPGASGRGAGGLVMEKVTILRRGESLDSATMKANLTGGGVGATFGDLYAGMAFAVSPEPSSLPVPSFGRARKDGVGGGAAFDDSATKDLRRLLRLD